MTDVPESPPSAPVIPVGIGTKLGLAGTIVLAVASGLTAILPGDLSGQTKVYATLAAVISAATILGRMLQSAAALFGAPAMAEPSTPGLPTEDELRAAYPGDQEGPVGDTAYDEPTPEGAPGGKPSGF